MLLTVKIAMLKPVLFHCSCVDHWNTIKLFYFVAVVQMPQLRSTSGNMCWMPACTVIQIKETWNWMYRVAQSRAILTALIFNVYDFWHISVKLFRTHMSTLFPSVVFHLNVCSVCPPFWHIMHSRRCCHQTQT